MYAIVILIMLFSASLLQAQEELGASKSLPDAPQPQLTYSAPADSPSAENVQHPTLGSRLTYVATHELAADMLNPAISAGGIRASLLDRATSSFMNKALMPALLHQDVRYYGMYEGNVFRRFCYATSRVFITRSDDGSAAFNSSELAGSVAAATISNAYVPGWDKGVRQTASRALTSIGSDAGMYLMKEFMPGLTRKLHLRGNDLRLTQ